MLFLNFYSLPMMFGRKMFLEIETRGLVDAFRGYYIRIGRLGKKIGCRKV